MKIKSTLVAATLLAASVNAFAGDWTKADTAREIAFDAELVMDHQQTLYIHQHYPQYHELNPILGSNPSSGAVDRYFFASALGHYAISYFLPPSYRGVWQYVTLGVEGSVVYHNYSIGIRAPF